MLNTSRCEDYFKSVIEFAKKINKLDNFQQNLDFLDNYACPPDDKGKTKCLLFKDFAPNSFEFTMQRRDPTTGEYKDWFMGGLIYYGPDEDGTGAPQLSVRIGDTTCAEWTINT